MTVAEQIAALAHAIGKPNKVDLTYGSFAAGNYTADSSGSGVATPAALYRVPAGVMLGLLTRKDFRLVIRGHGQFTGPVTPGSQTFDMTTVGFTNGIAELPQGTSVYAYENGTLNQPTNVAYDTGIVTITTTVASSTIDIFATPIDGHAELQVVLPTAGLGGIAVPIWAEGFNVLHQTDQTGSDSAPRLTARGPYIPLFPRWQLGIYVDSPVTVQWVANAKQRVHIHAATRQVRPSPQEAAQLESIWLANHQGF